MIYGIPDTAEDLLVFNTSSEEMRGVSTRDVSIKDTAWRMAVAVGDVIYAIPRMADTILVFDTVNERAHGISTSSIYHAQAVSPGPATHSDISKGLRSCVSDRFWDKTVFSLG